VGQEVLTVATNTWMKQNITYNQNGFRAFSRKTFNIFTFKQNRMAIESEMLMDASDAGLVVKEVPINVRYDVKESTYNLVTHGVGVLNSVIMLVSQRRSLLFFCVPGFALFLVGSIFSFLVLDAFNVTLNFAIGDAMIAILFTIIGVFSIFTGLILASIQSINFKNY
jgi:hypothetical protein